jgi:hypothetical protein
MLTSTQPVTISPANSQTKVEEPEEEIGIAFTSEVRPSRYVYFNVEFVDADPSLGE